jgi:hypothetical protein
MSNLRDPSIALPIQSGSATTACAETGDPSSG